MKTLKLALPAAILGAGFLICATASYGTAVFAKKEGKTCVYCHVAAGKKDLNDTGKCYKSNDKSLAKCPVPAEKKDK
jgi:cytochrome c553